MANALRMLTRRQWIGGGVAVGVALAAASMTRFRFFDGDEPQILAAIAPVLLDGALPVEPAARAAAIRSAVAGFDAAVAGLPPSVQADVAQVFTILRVAPLRIVVAGVLRPWPEASSADIASFLQRWRYSGISTLRAAYDALHQLTLAAWYGNPQSWGRIGYPGPPKVG